MTGQLKRLLKVKLGCSANRSIVCALMVLTAGWLTSCSKAPEGPASPTYLARVGDKLITAEDLVAEAARRSVLKRNVPDKRTLLKEMIEHESLLQKARISGLDKDAQIKREMENLLIEKLLDTELKPQVANLQVSPQEVQNYYNDNISEFSQPALVRLALLYLELNPKMSKEKRSETCNRMAEARQKIASGHFSGGFGALAIEYSDDPGSRYRGGDIGWLEEGKYTYRWPREVLDSGYRGKIGELSSVFETETGVYLVMKTDFRSASVRSLAQVEGTIRQKLLVQKRRDLENNYREEIYSSLSVNTDTAALAALEFTPPERYLAKQSAAEPPSLPTSQETKVYNGN